MIFGLMFLGIVNAFSADAGKVAVVYTSGNEAFGEAIEGFRASLAGTPYQVVLLDLKSQQAELGGLLSHGAKAVLAVVAVGGDALRAVAQTKTTLPVIETMVMSADRNSNGPPKTSTFASIYLDVPALGLLQEIKSVLRRRVARKAFDWPAACGRRRSRWTSSCRGWTGGRC